MKYTEEMREFILENYKGVSTKELVERFNLRFETSVTLSMMKGYKANHKLNSGLTGYFPKGHIPANKGTKGIFNAGGNKTSFKTGQLPPNTEITKSGVLIARMMSKANKLKRRKGKK